MNNKRNDMIIRRILVALDVSPPSLAALEVAADLAGQLQAELMGLFIEDVNLLKLAQLPFVNEIQYPRAAVQKIDLISMETQLRMVADQARALLRESAERRNLVWNFRVVRGVVANEIQTAAREADLLVLGRISRRLVRSDRVGSTAAAVVNKTKQPVLLLHAGLDLSRPILLFYDGSDAAHLALKISALLAAINESLFILIWAEDKQTDRKYRQEITDQLQDDKLTLKFHRLSEKQAVIDVISSSDFGLFVVGDAQKEPSTSIIQILLQEMDYPFLVIR
jgi:nucleotide-binding universal stress UspA family protein